MQRFRDGIEDSTRPMNALAKMGEQVINASTDAKMINKTLNSTGPKYYLNSPTSGVSNGVNPTNIERLGMSEYFTCNQGEWAFVLRQDRENDRHQRAFKGKPSQAGVPVRTHLAGWTRPDKIAGALVPGSPDDILNALLIEESISVIGMTNKPDSSDDNQGNFTLHLAGPETVVNGGTQQILQGDLVEWHVPNNAELPMGHANESSQTGKRPVPFIRPYLESDKEEYYKPLVKRHLVELRDKVFNGAIFAALRADGVGKTTEAVALAIEKVLKEQLGWPALRRALALELVFLCTASLRGGMSNTRAVIQDIIDTLVDDAAITRFYRLNHMAQRGRHIYWVETHRKILGRAEEDASPGGEFGLTPLNIGCV